MKDAPKTISLIKEPYDSGGDCLFWWDGSRWVAVPFCEGECICGNSPGVPMPGDEPTIIVPAPCIARLDISRYLLRTGHIISRTHAGPFEFHAAHWDKTNSIDGRRYGSEKDDFGNPVIPEEECPRPGDPRKGNVYLYGSQDDRVFNLGIGRVCEMVIDSSYLVGF